MKLHLGCWQRDIPGFINVDLCDMPHIHHQSSIEDLSMFEDNSVELIYSSHNFEYFDPVQAPKVLAEWRRVLKPGGTLRLAVPDFAGLAQAYLHSGKLDGVLAPLFGRMEIETNTGLETLYHRTVYDLATLKKLLEENGFGGVTRYDWQKTIHKDYYDYSHDSYQSADGSVNVALSLNVEAVKA